MDFKVERRTIADLFDHPDFEEVIDEYSNECAITLLPSPNPVRGIYEQLEANHVIHTYLVLDDVERLLGFAILLFNIFPHYGLKMAVAESLFVRKEARRLGVWGEALKRELERDAESQGCDGLFFSSPIGSQFDKVMDGSDYIPINRVWFKRFYREGEGAGVGDSQATTGPD